MIFVNRHLIRAARARFPTDEFLAYCPAVWLDMPGEGRGLLTVTWTKLVYVMRSTGDPIPMYFRDIAMVQVKHGWIFSTLLVWFVFGTFEGPLSRFYGPKGTITEIAAFVDQESRALRGD